MICVIVRFQYARVASKITFKQAISSSFLFNFRTSIGTSASAHPFSFDILQKNVMLGGALTGALVSAASKENKDKVLVDVIYPISLSILENYVVRFLCHLPH
ncbi:hypothetical protein C1H46_002509 [Malus baccata]|uniref:Uncharacterized protein n=1 Tax=Malus baccata TaxID=106549 RepID=A0A540NLH6_MALBA|nr:hypothetical protein C1H46_002509 [Malus baccata]